MSNNFYSRVVSTVNETAQTEPIFGRENEMKKNNAGGYSFTIDMWEYLNRFLILGSEQPTYYVSAKKLTLDNVQNVLACIAKDGIKVINKIVKISTSGRAPKNDSAIFALALCAIYGDELTRKYAYSSINSVCRIGTHLFQFVDTLNEVGKWNNVAKKGIANWYLSKSEDDLAYQLLKYQSRNGWSHRDVLRLSHVKPQSDVQNNMFKYAVNKEVNINNLPKLFQDVERLKTANKNGVISIIRGNKAVTWEMIPTAFLRDKDVMSELVPNMGMTALIRKLGQLTNIGVITNGFNSTTRAIADKISNPEVIKKSRVHPITILNALKQYNAGHGFKGSLSWYSVQTIVDALDSAFYDAFSYIAPTKENYLLGVDCSGSMFGVNVHGMNITAAEVAAVMALALAKREPNYLIHGFSNDFVELKISPKMRLDAVLLTMQHVSWASTNCSVPMQYAIKKNISNVDKFVIITDNETYSGNIHPSQALEKYRNVFHNNAKLIVCGTTATNFTIADPKMGGMLDIVGFDSASPQLIQQF